MERVLVTGASGFIGRMLCKKLFEEKKWVRALIRQTPDDECFKNDSFIHNGYHHEVVIQDLFHFPKGTLSEKWMDGIDTVYHLAGVAHAKASKEQYELLNVRATEALFELAKSAGVKHFVYFSSVKACHPKDEYGRSKRAAERILLETRQKTDPAVTILRPALVYGVGMKGNLRSMLKAVKRGIFPPIPEIHNERSMVSLSDLTEAALLVGNSSLPELNGKIYTITDGVTYSTRQLYDAMRMQLGLKPLRWSLPYWPFWLMQKFGFFKISFLDKLLGSAYFSNEAICHDLGFQPKEDFFKVLPQMVESVKIDS